MWWFSIVAATIPTLICGCPYSCLLYQNASLTCNSSAALSYVERAPYTCIESPEFCNLPSKSEIGVVYESYDGQPIVVAGSSPVNCANSTATVFQNDATVFSGPLSLSDGACVVSPDFDYASNNTYTLAVYLEEFMNGANGTVTLSPSNPYPAFDAAFGLSETYTSFRLSPRTGCCVYAPTSSEVGNECDVVEFLFASDEWVATTKFDVACATGSTRLVGATQYFFNVTIFGNASSPCLQSRIAFGYYNASQIVLDTSSPTFTPTFDPGRLVLTPIETTVVDDAICPVTVSGFAKPFFSTRAVTDLTPSFRTGSIWFPPSLFSVDSGDDFFNLTSGACVPQDESCVAYWSASAQVEAPDGSESVLANAVGSDSTRCVARSPCYPGESQNVDSTFPTQLVVDWPSDPTGYAIVDVLSAITDPDVFVTFDTLRITYLTLTGVLRYDVSAQYKANVMSSPSYPEYANGLFCRFNDTLFFVPPRVNAWTMANLTALNSTLCEYVSDPRRDRVMVIPANLVFGTSSYVTLVLEGFGQIRSNGSFVGCVYARSSIAPIPSNVVVSNPIVLIYELVFGIVGGLFVLFVLFEIARRRNKRRKTPPGSGSGAVSQPPHERVM